MLRTFLKITNVCFLILVALLVVTNPVFAQTLKEQNTAAITQYNEARTQYKKQINDAQILKAEFEKRLKEFRQFRKTADKSAIETQARTLLNDTIGTGISYLEALKIKVQTASGLSETERNEIITEINQNINWLQQKQTKIASSTLTSIRKEAQEAKNYWKVTRVSVKKISGIIAASYINNFLLKGDNVSRQIQTQIDTLKNQDRDTSELEDLLVEYNQNLALAKEKYEAGKAQFRAIKGGAGLDIVPELNESNVLVQKGNVFIQDANRYIRQAHAQLVEIAKTLKQS